MTTPTITPQLEAWELLQWKIAHAAIPADVLMTPEEAAAYIGCTPNALGVRRYNGNGPTYRKAGRAIRYRKGDIDAWLTEQTQTKGVNNADTLDTTEN